MARNCCGGSLGCGCKVSAGDGILISGSGTASDPFVITSEVTSFAAAFVTQDTTTVDLTLTGSGTDSDPFLLRADADIAMTQLSDWDDPAGPAVGDVPVWNGLAWEAAAPPTVPPGAVTANTGITGDGTVITPLKIAVSDTVSTTTSGLATYIDTAGKLRAVPPVGGSVSWASITDKPSTFPTTWTDVAGKPTTFPPQIGTTATTAKAGNWFPTAVQVPSNGSNVQADIDALASSVGSAASTANAAYTLANTANNSAATRALSYGGDPNAVRYAQGPTGDAYTRTVGGGGFFAVWMDNTNQFGRNVSARKYKQDIEAYTVDPAAVLGLQPVQYVLKSSPEAGPQYGLIADDVASLLPEVVIFEDGEPESIRYDLLAVALLDVVKDLSARVVALEGVGS